MDTHLEIGTNTHPWAGNKPIIIDAESRFQHVHCVGQTGTGKSTLLKQLFIQDVLAGNGCCYIDPHGVDAEELLDCIPADRIDDVIYFNPSDRSNPIGFNILSNVPPEQIDTHVEFTVAGLNSLWANSWGARMDDILKAVLVSLLEVPGRYPQTFLAIERMLLDPGFRNWVVTHTRNPSVRDFWDLEFSKWNPRQQSDFCQPVLNKVRAFTRSNVIRNIIGQPSSSFDFAHAMENRKIIIANLDVGNLGIDTSNLLGTLLISAIRRDVMQRSVDRNNPDALPGFYTYLDEFQTFTSLQFANILSELRKFKLSMTLSHQFLEQVDEEVLSAVFGNTGTFIAFRVGSEDAEVVATHTDTTTAHVEDLSDFHFAVRTKLHRDTITYKGRTEYASLPNYGYGKSIVANSRNHYGRPIERVEEAYGRWRNNQRFKSVGARAKRPVRGRQKSRQAPEPTIDKSVIRQ